MSGQLIATPVAAGSGAATLAVTGYSTFWPIVTGLALVMFGIMVKRLVPRKEF